MTTEAAQTLGQQHAGKSEDVTIVTLGINSALQILKGAKDEGFHTVAAATSDRAELYRRYGFIDGIIELSGYQGFNSIVEEQLDPDKSVVVPHSSFLGKLGTDAIADLKLPMFGNRRIIRWESDRDHIRDWLTLAGVNLPRQFRAAEDIDGPVVVKARGGMRRQGYFFARNRREYERKVRDFQPPSFTVQEYIIGVPVMLHYFQSPLDGTLQFMGADKRYQTNVDSLGRIPTENQAGLGIEPSYVTVGNFPLALRESMLTEVYRLGEGIVEAGKAMFAPAGLYGAFSVEAIIAPSQQFFIIEFTTTISGATNLYIDGSPYSQLFYDEPMSMGRRTAREIKCAIETDRLVQVTCS
jgi:5-formaminoimidazole-4-carboxamide-1-(beta)-D-ribofuranosyl 5'-monophosphate synthetase